MDGRCCRDEAAEMMATDKAHPSQRFTAPYSIQRGTPLKELMDRRLVALIGESLSAIVEGFDLVRFQTFASRGLDRLELKQRAMKIADAMAEQLPASFAETAPLLVKAFGPPLEQTDGNGLAPFFYFPHSQLIASRGVSHFESGMLANFELTKRFTAEFSIRPFLIQYRSPCLEMLNCWTKDKNAHVRRLVSEGTRPRLPWAMRMPEFQANPDLALPLLELLKDDAELYVRRSVANHLGDIAKDHPAVALRVCETWVEEVKCSNDEAVAGHRCWIVRHALRYPAKKGNSEAIRIRAMAAQIGGRGRNV